MSQTSIAPDDDSPDSSVSPDSVDPEVTFERVPAALRAALIARGFDSLTTVQEAVLDPALVGRDLRISSQTGSGKTVALGFAIARFLDVPNRTPGTKAIVIAPTRELAAQVRGELAWLFEGIRANVVQVTGGTSVRDELRVLKGGPEVVVATPGRLLDHLDRGAIDASQVAAVVLDEADQMLDLGFRDDLEAILGKLPAERQTLLVSATFSRDIMALARRYQKDAVAVEGTRLGEANVDIAHEVHVVPPMSRNDALVNLILLAPTEQTLIFARTREGAANIARGLSDLGFAAAPITGDMDQSERTRALEAFRAGHLAILVGTDVAARGIDVPDVTRVIHADLPGNSEVYTHRSGRTGRAGRKGKSILLITPSEREMAIRMIRRARVHAEELPVPTPEQILKAADERFRSELGAPHTDDELAPDARVRRLATRLLAEVDPLTLVVRLLARVRHAGPTPPREIRMAPPPRPERYAAPGGVDDRRPQRGGQAEVYAPRSRGPRDGYDARPAGRDSRDGGYNQASGGDAPRVVGDRRSVEGRPQSGKTFRAFHVTWGQRHGADARRMLALVCRRGGIQGSDVGSIDIGPTTSTVEVSSAVATAFAAAAREPDDRDPRIKIEAVDGAPAAAPAKAAKAPSAPGSAPAAPKSAGSAPAAARAGGATPPRRRVVRA